MKTAGWIGVDLDGTLAHYDGHRGIEHIGAPIPAMVERVKRWLAEGRNVRIFTARVTHHDTNRARSYVEFWCREHLGQVLPVVCTKDLDMDELWDDRVVAVEPNTGRPLNLSRRGLTPEEGVSVPYTGPKKQLSVWETLYRACFERYTIESDMADPNPVLAALERLTAAAMAAKRS